MKTLAAALLFSLLSSASLASPNAALTTLRSQLSRHYVLGNGASLKGYVRVNLEGWESPAFALEEGQARSSSNQPGTLIFDANNRLVAVGFARPSSSGVEVLDLESFSVWHLHVASAVAAR